MGLMLKTISLNISIRDVSWRCHYHSLHHDHGTAILPLQNRWLQCASCLPWFCLVTMEFGLWLYIVNHKPQSRLDRVQSWRADFGGQNEWLHCHVNCISSQVTVLTTFVTSCIALIPIYHDISAPSGGPIERAMWVAPRAPHGTLADRALSCRSVVQANNWSAPFSRSHRCHLYSAWLSLCTMVLQQIPCSSHGICQLG